MAQLNIAIEHGQTPEAARGNFERTVNAAQAQYGRWIHRLDWSADRTRVTLAGPGYEVELSYDDQKVYARGTVPLAFKLLEGPVKAFIKQTLASTSFERKT
jgi:Putative polyhydroxyalkanoic acid system protein (PHA_gran_rgn)